MANQILDHQTQFIFLGIAKPKLLYLGLLVYDMGNRSGRKVINIILRQPSLKVTRDTVVESSFFFVWSVTRYRIQDPFTCIFMSILIDYASCALPIDSESGDKKAWTFSSEASLSKETAEWWDAEMFTADLLSCHSLTITLQIATSFQIVSNKKLC